MVSIPTLPPSSALLDIHCPTTTTHATSAGPPSYSPPPPSSPMPILCALTFGFDPQPRPSYIRISIPVPLHLVIKGSRICIFCPRNLLPRAFCHRLLHPLVFLCFPTTSLNTPSLLCPRLLFFPSNPSRLFSDFLYLFHLLSPHPDHRPPVRHGPLLLPPTFSS